MSRFQIGRSQPHCVHHAFVLQQDSSHTLYGICLRQCADEKRAETIRELRKRTEPGFLRQPGRAVLDPLLPVFPFAIPASQPPRRLSPACGSTGTRLPTCSTLRRCPERASFPAPRLNDLVRIDMKDYALCYQFPSSPTGFQNPAMWLRCPLSVPNIVGVIEAAISPTRRHLRQPLPGDADYGCRETVRYCVRVYEWSGLYVPVVHARHAKELVQEPGPYILVTTADVGLSSQPPRMLWLSIWTAPLSSPRSSQPRSPPASVISL